MPTTRLAPHAVTLVSGGPTGFTQGFGPEPWLNTLDGDASYVHQQVGAFQQGVLSKKVARGQYPALTLPEGARVLTVTVEVGLWLAQSYPEVVLALGVSDPQRIDGFVPYASGGSNLYRYFRVQVPTPPDLLTGAGYDVWLDSRYNGVVRAVRITSLILEVEWTTDPLPPEPVTVAAQGAAATAAAVAAAGGVGEGLTRTAGASTVAMLLAAPSVVGARLSQQDRTGVDGIAAAAAAAGQVVAGTSGSAALRAADGRLTATGRSSTATRSGVDGVVAAVTGTGSTPAAAGGAAGLRVDVTLRAAAVATVAVRTGTDGVTAVASLASTSVSLVADRTGSAALRATDGRLQAAGFTATSTVTGRDGLAAAVAGAGQVSATPTGTARLVTDAVVLATGLSPVTGRTGTDGITATAAASGAQAPVVPPGTATLRAGDTGLLQASGFAATSTVTGKDGIAAAVAGTGTVGAVTGAARLASDALLRATGVTPTVTARGLSGITGAVAGSGAAPVVPTGTGALLAESALTATGFAAVSVRANETTGITAGTIFVGDTRRVFTPDAALVQEVTLRCVGTAIAYLRTTAPEGIVAFASSTGQQGIVLPGSAVLRQDVALTATGFAGVSSVTARDGITAAQVAVGTFTAAAQVGTAALRQDVALFARASGAVILAEAVTAIAASSEQQARQVLTQVLTVIFPPVQAIINATGLARVETATGTDGITASIRAAQYAADSFGGAADLAQGSALVASRSLHTGAGGTSSLVGEIGVVPGSIASDVGSAMLATAGLFAVGVFGGGGQTTAPVLRSAAALTCEAQPDSGVEGSATLRADGGLLVGGANLPMRAPATTLTQGSDLTVSGYSDTSRVVPFSWRALATVEVAADSYTTTGEGQAAVGGVASLTVEAAPIAVVEATLAVEASAGALTAKVVVTPGVVPARADLRVDVLMLARPGVDVALITVRVSGIRLIGGPCQMTATGVQPPASGAGVDAIRAEATLLGTGKHVPLREEEFDGSAALTPTATVAVDGSDRPILLSYDGAAFLEAAAAQEVPGPLVFGGFGVAPLTVACDLAGSLVPAGTGVATGTAVLRDAGSALTAFGQQRTEAVLSGAGAVTGTGRQEGFTVPPTSPVPLVFTVPDAPGVHVQEAVVPAALPVPLIFTVPDVEAVEVGDAPVGVATLHAAAGFGHTPNPHYAGADLRAEARLSRTFPGSARVPARARVSCTGYDGSDRSDSRLRPLGDRLHSRARPVTSTSKVRASSRYAGSNTSTPDSAPPPLVVRPSTGTASPSGGPS